ncbi:MAG: PhzF family phenazine biosynthesis protein [Planctomycetes bacterium]|nr:PhzF family phenazine biosynthesis protein [Planctomycetota bacterium]
MRLKQFQVDAFTCRPFSGNPAAVCMLERWLSDDLLLAIAAENNLSETAFLVPRPAPREWDLRWFTPRAEVDLCGHATLASAHVLLTEFETRAQHVDFKTRSGMLRTSRTESAYRMDFPSRPPVPIALTDEIVQALGARPLDAWKARDLIVRFEQASQVRTLRPDLRAVEALDYFALCATAPGTDADAAVDFVSRFFAPRAGVPEDPVTGSAHCELAPYWRERLGRAKDGSLRFRARQIGPRGGELACECDDRRVYLYGQAVTVLRGELVF